MPCTQTTAHVPVPVLVTAHVTAPAIHVCRVENVFNVKENFKRNSNCIWQIEIQIGM